MNTAVRREQTAARRHLWVLRVALAAALVVSGVLFAVGVHAERSSHHEGSSEVAREPATHSESEGTATEPHSETGKTAGEGQSAAPREHTSEATEHVLGVNMESDAVVWLVVIASLVLAAGVLLLPTVSAFVWVAVVFSLAAAVFDIAEIAHQISRSDAGLAALAASIAIIHLAAAVLGVQIERQDA
jgi:hypothetical protein